MTYVVTSCLHAVKGLPADSSFNFCTTSITICLDHISNHSRIPLKSLDVIVIKLIARTTEQLRLLVRSSNDPRYKRKLHGIKDLPKAYRSLQPSGVLISPEMLSLTQSCLIDDVDVDLQQ
jgi:hypothetical protein